MSSLRPANRLGLPGRKGLFPARGCDGDDDVSCDLVPSFSFIRVGGTLSHNFTDESTSTATINSWSWDFGDGGSSLTKNPTYTFATPGTYLVRLTVQDSEGCEETITQTVAMLATCGGIQWTPPGSVTLTLSGYVSSPDLFCLGDINCTRLNRSFVLPFDTLLTAGGDTIGASYFANFDEFLGRDKDFQTGIFITCQDGRYSVNASGTASGTPGGASCPLFGVYVVNHQYPLGQAPTDFLQATTGVNCRPEFGAPDSIMVGVSI